MEVIILDSTSHEWEFLLDYHASLPGNSFTNWSKVTPRHNAFIQRILSSSCHIICSVRTKQDYVLQERNGKMIPEKVGLKSVQRDGLEYEMTIVFDLDIRNKATTSKDRTDLFQGKSAEKITVETGKRIADWCNSGMTLTADDISDRIQNCKSINDLAILFRQYPEFQQTLKPEFEARKREIIISKNTTTILPEPSLNGHGTH